MASVAGDMVTEVDRVVLVVAFTVGVSSIRGSLTLPSFHGTAGISAQSVSR